MIVVADTSPLNYLILLQLDHVLPTLYGQIIVPESVVQELQRSAAPPPVRAWIQRIPEWVVTTLRSPPEDPSLSFLHPGEREAIQIAQELRADLLLIDERRGDSEAKRRGIATTGTLGGLLTANRRGLIDARKAYDRLLSETTFRSSAALDAEFLKQLQTH